MSAIKGLEWTFDTVASTYEKFRPLYPDELYKMIFDYIALDDSCRAVEVGIGGGQATLPILKTGCNVTAVEYGEEFSKLCKEKFKDYKNFSVITNKFEDTNLPDDTYDLVYSASAFHWVPESIGYTKVFSMLKAAARLHGLQITLIGIKATCRFRKKWIGFMANTIINSIINNRNRRKSIPRNKLYKEQKLQKNMAL